MSNESEWNGEQITCPQCEGHGVVDRFYHHPDECGSCGGSGLIWKYASGVRARYYSGPLLSGKPYLRDAADDDPTAEDSP